MPADRIDSATRIIAAPPAAVYRALTEADALAAWLPPEGMRSEIYEFDPRPGGRYRMALIYERPGADAAGKSADDRDLVQGHFVELLPDARIVQLAEFQSDDPAFAGTMRMIWSLRAVAGGTEVTIACEDVPDGISPEDHDAGLNSSLENLAAYVE